MCAMEQKELKKGIRIKWTRKNRVLVLSERGITFRTRHLMQDLISLLPHSKTENKVDKDLSVEEINEFCELRRCNYCLFFQMKKKMDTYLWMAKAEDGPTVKFLVEGCMLNRIPIYCPYDRLYLSLVYTVGELSFKGNCLKGSRPVLSFSQEFDDTTNNKLAYLSLLKQMFIQTLGVPLGHPKSKPFVDRCLSFSFLDGKIWIRNYQIVYPDSQTENITNTKEMELVEIGPRFVLTPIVIFQDSFCGPLLFKNPKYVSPNHVRSQIKKQEAIQSKIRVASNMFLKEIKKARKFPETSTSIDPPQDH